MSSRKIRCLLLDPSSADRAWLRQHLALCHGAVVAGEAASLADARHMIATIPHDVVFADTRAGNSDAMVLARELRPGVRIAFVSDRSVDAVRAFELNALDFIAKPVPHGRLQLTFSRLRDQGPVPNASPRSVESFLSGARRLSFNQKVCIRSGSKARLTSPDQMLSITAQDNYSEITLIDGERVFVRLTMRAWENVLPWKHFFRTHRTCIVNLAHVTAWRRDGQRRFFISLRNHNPRVAVSRERWPALAPKIGAA